MKMYVGFPVEVPGHNFGEERYKNLHITLAYWPNITTVEASRIADWIASTSLWKMYLNDYHVIHHDSWIPDLFGPDKDIPVLKIQYTPNGWYDMAGCLRDSIPNGLPKADTTYPYPWNARDSIPNGLPKADTTYPWNAHVTVPLKLAIKQPQFLIVRPIHMWRGNRPPHPIVRK